MRAGIAALVAVALSLSTASAQSQPAATPPSPQSETKEQPAPQVDYSVPDAPAFSILGFSPTQVTNPTSGNDLLGAVATILGSDGKVHAGAAIEFGLGSFITTNLTAYQDDFLTRLAYNTRISIATASGQGEMSPMSSAPASTDLAFG